MLPRQQIFPVRVGYPRVSRNISKHYMDQSKLATWHVWCGTNIGHFLVRNNCRTFLTNQKLPRGMFGAEQMPDMFGVDQIPDMFGAEQISDIFWCGTNAGHFWCRTNNGHFLVRNKCRTFFGAEQIPDIFWCGTNAGHSLVHLWVLRLGTYYGDPSTALGGGRRRPESRSVPRVARQTSIYILCMHGSVSCPYLRAVRSEGRSGSPLYAQRGVPVGPRAHPF